MKIVADMHTHTLASTASYSTLHENIEAAKQTGLVAIAMTDHGPGLPGAEHISSITGAKDLLPDVIDGIRVFKGAEVNIMGTASGHLDISDDLLYALEWTIFSYHFIMASCPPDSRALTMAYTNLLKNPTLMVLGHADRYGCEYDVEEVVAAYRDAGRLIEINNRSLQLGNESRRASLKLAYACKRLKAPVVVNSDAHYSAQIGDVSLVMQMLQEISFPESLIINSDESVLYDYINKFSTWRQEERRKQEGFRGQYEQNRKY